jgi:hypothetical protein
MPEAMFYNCYYHRQILEVLLMWVMKTKYREWERNTREGREGDGARNGQRQKIDEGQKYKQFEFQLTFSTVGYMFRDKVCGTGDRLFRRILP